MFPRLNRRRTVWKPTQAATKIAVGVGLALVTMNLTATRLHNLPTVPNPLFGEVHEPGKRFRQQIEGNGSGIFTSNCVRRAALPAAGQAPVLLILGNSYTEATQVNDEDHFAHLLEQRLGGIPVLALGISSYSVADYVARAPEFKRLFRPDWVIIPVRAADFAANAWNKGKGGGYAYFSWVDRPGGVAAPETPPGAETALGVVQLPVSQSGWLSSVTREKFPSWFPLMTFAYRRKADLQAWMDGHERPWFKATAEVAGNKQRPEAALEKFPLEDEMRLLATAWEGRLTLLYLPEFDPIQPSKQTESEGLLRSVAEKQGVRFISLRAKFSALAAKGRTPYGFNNTRFNWGHWNGDGHEAAADVLFREYQRLEALGKLSKAAPGSRS